jgi:hypothetical protein
MRNWLIGAASCLVVGAATAGGTHAIAFFPAPIPALDEIGLTALTIAVGIAGGGSCRGTAG